MVLCVDEKTIGEGITQRKNRCRHQEFLGFLRQIEKSISADLDLHTPRCVPGWRNGRVSTCTAPD